MTADKRKAALEAFYNVMRQPTGRDIQKAAHIFCLSYGDVLKAALSAPQQEVVTVEELAKRLVKEAVAPHESSPLIDSMLFDLKREWETKLDILAQMFPAGIRITRGGEGE